MVKYKNNGFLQGLPARDMTMNEWESMPKELQTLGLDLGLYEIEKPKYKKEIKEGE